MKSLKSSVSIAGSELGAARHICAFFHNPDEEYRTLLPFIKAGFECGDRAFHVIDPGQKEQHLERLQSAGIDVAPSAHGQFKLLGWHDAHLQHGHFEQHNMIALLEAQLKEGAKEGFRLSRSIGHMGWALEGRPGTEDLLEYEARLNYMLPHYHDPVICVYDLSRFNGAIVADVLRTHPTVIIGGLIHENPFYVPPDEFLRELHERRSTPATKSAAIG